METKGIVMYLLVGVVVLVLAISVVQSFQIRSLKNQMTANAAGIVGNNIDMTGWTENEKMMYEHHGTLPARLQKNQQQANMVGGC